MRVGRRVATRVLVAVAASAILALLRSTGALGATLEVAYGEGSSDVTITAATCCTWYDIASTGSASYDGSTVVMFEGFISQADLAGGSPVRFALFEDGSMLGDALGIANNVGNTRIPMTFVRRFTPSSGSHTYSLRASTTNNTSTMRCAASAVQGIAMRPCFVRVSLANPTLDSGGGGGDTFEADDYYTAAELDAGALDGRYYTETEVDSAMDGCGSTLGDPCIVESAGINDRLDLAWWGTWALVGLMFVLLIAPRFWAAFRTTHGG